jgi:hypothetical protein
MELTDKQISRQDFVDNHIYNLLNDLFRDVQPHNQQGRLAWDIIDIAIVRDLIYSRIFKRLGVNEQDYYGFLNLEDDHAL